MIDYTILGNGFKFHKNRFTNYCYAMSADANENGDYQFCLQHNENGAKELVEFLNELILDYKLAKKNLDIMIDIFDKSGLDYDVMTKEEFEEWNDEI